MQTKVLRKVAQFNLNEGVGAAKGQYNITNTILMEYTKRGVSMWFDEETKDMFMRLSEAEFGSRAKQYAGNDIPSFLINDIVLNEQLKTIGVIIAVIEENHGYSYRTDSDGMREEDELRKIHKTMISEYVRLGYTIAPSTETIIKF